MLEAILRYKREEVARRKAEVSFEAHLAACSPSDRDFTAAVRHGRPGFILEVKCASPSAGAIREDPDLTPVIDAYGRHADAISVLTDSRFFGGSLDRMRRVRDAVRQPVLAKDFILEPYQVAEARRHGADAILLILAAIDDATWRECAGLADRLGMAVLTETHDAAEVGRAVALGASIIGINNRDLTTLAVDHGTVSRLAPRVPADRLVIAESGLGTRDAVAAARRHADGVLVGSALMREPDIDAAVRRLVYGRTKICGLTRAEDARAALDAGATHGGLVFVDGSPRRVTRAQAATLRDGVPLEWVGLFAGTTPADIAQAAAELGLVAAQLYGYDPEATARVRRALPGGREAWAAVRVTSRVPFRDESAADRLLLDASREGMLGGSGRRFDWGLLGDREDRAEMVLAGGITADNVAHAVALGTWALDLSSGVESAPGQKDAGRLGTFFARRRRLPGRGDSE
jgi:indole-3-glycerol phosphate synthase/phosphoribosylanthranilate isomerase